MPDAFVNVGGTWKKITRIAVNVSGTWKTVLSAFVNVGGTWKKYHVFFQPALAGGFAIGDVNVSPAASFQLNTDGTVTLTGNTSSAPTSWGTPTTTGIGASYWARLTKNSGNDPDSGSLGVWLQLNSNRQWFMQHPKTGGNFTLAISSDSGGSVIVATATGNWTLTAV